jgi:maleate cis-trans isomerase
MQPRVGVKRIGLLLPSSNTTAEAELLRLLPESITLHTARLRLSSIEPDSTLKMVEELEAESLKLADADVDAIVLAATAPSSRKGLGYDRELIGRISTASGKPATTASTGMIEALGLLGVRRLVLGAPWTEAVNEIAAKFIEASDFEVLSHHALGWIRNLDVGLLAAESAYEMGRRIDRPDADAVVLVCGNWRTMEIISRLEGVLGKPVLTTNQVSLWSVLRLMAVVDPLPGYGTLLAQHLAGPA